MASSLGPREALAVFEDLQRSRQAHFGYSLSTSNLRQEITHLETALTKLVALETPLSQGLGEQHEVVQRLAARQRQVGTEFPGQQLVEQLTYTSPTAVGSSRALMARTVDASYSLRHRSADDAGLADRPDGSGKRTRGV